VATVAVTMGACKKPSSTGQGTTGGGSASAPIPPAKHPGVKALDLGPALTLSDADTATAKGLEAKAEWGYTSDGVPVCDFGDSDDAKAAVKAASSVLPYIARSSTDSKTVVAALSSMSELIEDGEGTDGGYTYPTDNKQLLLGLMTSQDPHIAAAASSLAENALKDDADVQKLLWQLCTDYTEPVTRATACNAAASRADLTSDKDAVAGLDRALDDESNVVLIRVLDALDSVYWSLAPSDMADKLIALSKSSEPLIRGLAISALDDYADVDDDAAKPDKRDAIKLQTQALLKDKSGFVRGEAGDGLASHFGWASVDSVISLLDDTADVSDEMPYENLSMSPDTPTKDSWSLSVSSGSFGGQVNQLVLGALDSAAEGVDGDLQFKPSNNEDFDSTKKEFLDWWNKNGAALKAQGSASAGK
jgi:hypothetical protein